VEDSKRGHKFHRVYIVAAVLDGENGTKKIAPECSNRAMTSNYFESWFEMKLLKQAVL
jgi:hypothetical protein